MDHYSDPTGTESCNMQIRWGTWLSPLPFTSTYCKIMKRTACSTVQKLQVRLHAHAVWSSLARTDSHGFLAPSIVKKREKTKERKREKFYIYSDVTHTHTPGRSRVNPERQEEEKSGHTTGRRPKTAQGGRGTDGPPEPTCTAKRTWPKQRTHLNPTTHYGEARGED